MKKCIALTLLLTGFLGLKAESDITSVGSAQISHASLNRLEQRAKNLADKAKAATESLLQKNQEEEELKKKFASKDEFDKEAYELTGIAGGTAAAASGVVAAENPSFLSGIASKAAKGLESGAERLGEYIPSLASGAGKVAKTVGGTIAEASPLAIGLSAAVGVGLLAEGAAALISKARDKMTETDLSPESQEEATKLAQQAQDLLDQAQQNIGQVNALAAQAQ